LIFDLDGVLYVDDEGVPGAGGALRTLEEAGHRLLFVTNNASKTAQTAADHIWERTGFQASPETVVTSGMATARYLAGAVHRALVLGEPALEETLRHGGVDTTDRWQDADAVVVGLDRGLTYGRLAAAALAVRQGARFVATNVDSTYPTPRGLLPGGGAIVAAVATATGVEPEVCGKPEKPMREMVRALVGRGPAWVIGDRIETDLVMGAAEGWMTVLVLTGVDDEASLAVSGLTPDLVLGSVASLPAAIEGQ
jgi:HAD superfamily hydrolase (TIGR01450 family)